MSVWRYPACCRLTTAPGLSGDSGERHLREAKTLLASELKELETLKAQRSLLSEFLAAVPLDALRGTVKRLVSSEEEIASRQKLIEDASDEWIFSNRDEDE